MADSLRSDAYRSIIRNLREERERVGIQQTELSATLHKAPNYISRIETCERRLGIVEMIQIGRALGMSADIFFTRIIEGVAID